MRTKSASEIERKRVAAIAKLYLRQVESLTYAQLRARQEAPWANISMGALGIAAAVRSGQSARRWITDASRRTAAWGAFFGPPEFDEIGIRPSVYFGPDGIHFVRMLIGPQRKSSMTRFVATCRRRIGGPAELLRGVAGTLTSAILVHRRTGCVDALDVAGDLARDLLARASGRHGWMRDDTIGFAHGRAGIFFALLCWAQAANCSLPEEISDGLAELRDGVRPRISIAGRRAGDKRAREVIARSWCNGAAGLTLLWARAYEVTRHGDYLRAAHTGARFVETKTRGAPADTQLTELPAAPAMARFWNPGGSSTAAVVSTLPKLTLVRDSDLYLDQLRLVPMERGAVRAKVRIGPPLEFSSGADDFVLEHDEE